MGENVPRQVEESKPEPVPMDARQHPRVPLLTQVESHSPALASLGRARNLSVGGILIETPETLPEGSDVIVRFFVPPGQQPVEAVGRVVRAEPGRSMGIAFLGLPASYRQRILHYVREVHGGKNGLHLPHPSTLAPQKRRSARVPRRLAVMLNWQDEEGKVRQEAAETKLLSRYGALLSSYSYMQLEAGRVVRLSLPELSSEARSRVVYSALADLPGHTEIALEFIGSQDFWGITFPPDTATLLPTRRRTLRLRKRIPLDLSWETASGVSQQEATETLNLSQHGVRLFTSNTLEVGRLLQLRQPDTGQLASARVVWREPGAGQGRLEMGLEILGRNDFWGIEFPPDRDYPA